MWRDTLALLAFAKAVGVVVWLGCFFVVLFRERLTLKSIDVKRWPF